MRKKSVIQLMTLITCLLTPFLFNNSTQKYEALDTSETTFVKQKTISLVYDASTSMYTNKDDRWVYSQYAMQSLEGLMNDQDTLYVTTTKNTTYTKKIDVSNVGVEKSIQEYVNMTKKDYASGTPYGSVQTAKSKLLEVSRNATLNDEYYLIVLTDGEFAGIPITNSNYSEFDNMILDFENFVDSNTFTNGTKPVVVFLGMCASSSLQNDEVKRLENKGIYARFAGNETEIIGMMSSISNLVSGRTDVSDKIKQISGDTLEVDANLPLQNVSLLLQNEDANIISVKDDKNKDLHIARNVRISKTGDIVSLKGRAALFDNNRLAINSKKFTVKFDRSVNVKNVNIMFEPAIEIKPNILINNENKSLTDLLTSHADDNLSMEFNPYVSGTDTKLSDWGDLPKITYSVNYGVEGEDKLNYDGNKLPAVDLKDKKTDVTINMKIDGYNPIEKTYTFIPLPPVPRLESFYIDENKSINVNEMPNNKSKGIGFNVYNGKTLLTNKNEVLALNPKIETSSDISGNMEVSNDGKIYFYPTSYKGTSEIDEKSIDITCRLSNGLYSTLPFDVMVANYKLVAEDVNDKVDIFSLKDNKVGAKFSLLRNGTKINLNDYSTFDIESITEKNLKLKNSVEITDDGSLFVIPKDVDNYHSDNFLLTWLDYINHTKDYRGDITVSVKSKYGEANSKIEDDTSLTSHFWWAIFSGVVFFGIIAIIIGIIILHIWMFITHGRFKKNSKLYIFDVSVTRGKITFSGLSSLPKKEFHKLIPICMNQTSRVDDFHFATRRGDKSNKIYLRNNNNWSLVSLAPLIDGMVPDYETKLLKELGQESEIQFRDVNGVICNKSKPANEKNDLNEFLISKGTYYLVLKTPFTEEFLNKHPDGSLNNIQLKDIINKSGVATVICYSAKKIKKKK